MALLFKPYLLKTRLHYRQFSKIIFKTVTQQPLAYKSNLYFRTFFNINKKIMKPSNSELYNWQYRMYAKKVTKSKKGKSSVAVISEDEMMGVVNVHAYKQYLQNTVDKLKEDFVTHLSLRTAVGNIDTLPVKIDEEEHPLNELAQISKKNPNLIVINMAGFPDGLKPAIQAINDSGMGVNPQQEGTMIYLPIPKVTRELRETLAKNAKTLCTTAKNEIREIQNNFIKSARKQTSLSEDLIFSTTKQLTSMADEYLEEIEKIFKIKHKDLLGSELK